jgi:hypothetical protein
MGTPNLAGRVVERDRTIVIESTQSRQRGPGGTGAIVSVGIAGSIVATVMPGASAVRVG